MQLPDTSRSSSSEHESNRSGGDETSWTASDVEEFFEEKIESWQAVLGRTMHYNFGTLDPNAGADDAEAHLNHSVRSLYPWIPVGAHVLDAGCGWGGPARLLVEERDARVHGVTVSQSQVDFFTADIPEATCSCQDLAHLDLSENVDVTIALESLTHVSQAAEALRHIRKRTNRLIVRDHVHENESLDIPWWHMRVHSVADLRSLLEQTGFHIEHEERVDVPWECVARFWHRNIQSAFPLFTPDGQFSTLESTCRQIIAHGPPNHQIRLIVAS